MPWNQTLRLTTQTTVTGRRSDTQTFFELDTASGDRTRFYPLEQSMITALVSTILGMLGGVLPDVMKEVRESRQAARELEHMDKQAELQVKVAQFAADSRMREVEGNVFVEEAKAFREHLTAIIETQAKPTGIAWVDAFNALLRPVCVSLIMLLFMSTAIPFVWAILEQFRAGAITAEDMATVIWGSLVGESILAALGFLFGFRSAAKRPGSVT